MGIRKILSRYIVLGVLIILGAATFYYYLIYLPYQAAKETGVVIARQMDEKLNVTPRINVENFIVMEAETPILELAVISQQVEHTYHYKDNWLGSTKELMTRGVYLAKAGFDLKKHSFIIDIDQSGQPDSGLYRIGVTLPPPEILSFSTQAYKILRDEEGWWNKLTTEEREQAVNQVREDARRKTIREGILDKAKDSMEEQLTEIILSAAGRENIGEIRFRYLSSADSDSLHINNPEQRPE